MHRWSLAAVLFAASGASFAQTLADCDSQSATTVLSPATAREARAAWIDARTILWPGAAADGKYHLQHGGGAIPLTAASGDIPARFAWMGSGTLLRLPEGANSAELLQGELLLVRDGGDSTRVQPAGALDALYASAADLQDLGVSVTRRRTAFRLWAPTAAHVAVCTYADGTGHATALVPMRRDARTGSWSATLPRNASGNYYTYLVDVFMPNVGMVRNRVTDPYSISLTTDSQRSYIADLAAPSLKPADWDKVRAPATVHALPDMSVYELHVRDFSRDDMTVPADKRGKYAAFGIKDSNGMRHLAALAKAGMTDVHLLPVFDFGSVPEKGCAVPQPSGAPDSEAQQALVNKTAETDCFNWGYDPVHYSAPEGSYASDPSDGAVRIREFRAMVRDLHKAGLRVGMDVVYNHTYDHSILERIVPGYYHRLNGTGAIERSTCCDNTATENLMMGKLMSDSVAMWAKQYKIDSFRFDLMGHQPRAAMEALQARLGRNVQLIGEGWNFGEVADGKRFVQASQLSLNGSGIGTFSDRARDAVRGGGAGDSGEDMVRRKGWINGGATAQSADMVRVGLAGSLRHYMLGGRELQAIDYAGQPAGYASIPGEAVNYVENHDNQTLFDINVLKLPLETSANERARVQLLAAAVNAFSQGVAYYHAGIDLLRSKSLDRNSFNSGDWFNRIDWSYQDNYFGIGLPRADDNGKDWPLLKPFLGMASIKPAPADIAFMRDTFRDLLAIRASSTLFRLRTADDVAKRLRFIDTGTPALVAATLDGKGYPGARWSTVAYFLNADTQPHSVALKGKFTLHPAHRADPRTREARYDAAAGTFTIPPRTAVVYVN